MTLDIETIDPTSQAYGKITRKVADRFRAVILDWLGPDTCRAVDRTNATLGPAFCATHDHCDANMAMDKAMKDLGVYDDDDDAFTDVVTDLWDKAWDMAKKDGFAPNH